jgi:hypothetical protein
MNSLNRQVSETYRVILLSSRIEQPNQHLYYRFINVRNKFIRVPNCSIYDLLIFERVSDAFEFSTDVVEFITDLADLADEFFAVATGFGTSPSSGTGTSTGSAAHTAGTTGTASHHAAHHLCERITASAAHTPGTSAAAERFFHRIVRSFALAALFFTSLSDLLDAITERLFFTFCFSFTFRSFLAFCRFVRSFDIVRSFFFVGHTPVSLAVHKSMVSRRLYLV